MLKALISKQISELFQSLFGGSKKSKKVLDFIPEKVIYC